ncbi:MAG: protein kinase [Candidatus Obscuribacterales bacterium]|jgi:serine/threonine protein kinase
MNPQNNQTPPEDDLQANTSLAGSGATGDFRPFVSGSFNLSIPNEAGKLQPGDLLGDYEIISLLGVGGMGYVYKAKHRILNKIYALKTLDYEKVNETAWRRLQLEAQAIARMNHPNIIAIHNLGLHDGVLPFYVMDLLVGENLADLLVRTGPLPLAEALPIFIGVAAGLGYAHKKGIIHRDIKPGNIFLLKEKDATGSRVKLVDFGIAKLSGVEAEVQNLTTAGEIFGSPYYMSPEHCDGKRIDARSDIYSVGCTFFEILTGATPFRGANSIQTMLMHQSQQAPRLSKVTGGKVFPEALEEMIATMLEKAPMDRYQNLEEVGLDLEDILQDLKSSTSERTSKDTESENGRSKHPIQFALKVCLAAAVLLAAGGTLAYWLIEENKRPAAPVKPIENSGITPAVSTANISTTAATATATSTSTTSSSENKTIGASEDTGKTEVSSTSVASVTSSDATSPNASSPNASSPNATSPNATSPVTDATTDSSDRLSSVIRPIKPYFDQVVDDKGVSKLKFDFGADYTLGFLEVEGQERLIPAQGIQLVPLGKEITLQCSQDLVDNPWLLDGFSPHDLSGLVFKSSRLLDRGVVSHILRLEDLKKLSISSSPNAPSAPNSFNGECLRRLDGLKQLKMLELVDTRLGGSDLAALNRLKRFKHLTYSPLQEPSVLLTALTPSKNLTELTLERGVLSVEDFRAIASCSNLRVLRVNDTQMDNQSMSELAALSNLKFLEARQSSLDKQCLKSLRKMKKLQALTISWPKMEAIDTVDFSTALGIPVH